MTSAPRTNERIVSFLDQACFSAANLVVLVSFARGFDTVDFAGYGLGFAVAIVASSVYRIAFVTPMAIGGEADFQNNRAAFAARHLMLVGGAIGLAALATLAAHVGGWPQLARAACLAAVATLAALLPQDFDRAFLFRSGRARASLVWSVGFLIVTLALAGLILGGFAGFVPTMAILTIFGIVKTLAVSQPVTLADFRAGGRRLVVSLRGDAGWNMAGILAASGYVHAPLFVLGLNAPALNVAAFTAMRAPLQPLQIVIRSLDLVDKLIFGRLDQADRAGRARHLVRTYVTYVVVGLALAGAIAGAANPLIRLLLGDVYVPFADTLRLWAVVFVLMTSSLPLETAMLAAGRHRDYALYQAAGGAVAVAAAFPLSRQWLDAGAVLACIAGWSVTYALVAGNVFRMARRAGMRLGKDEPPT